jgi:cytochrome c oxidase subunit 2
MALTITMAITGAAFGQQPEPWQLGFQGAATETMREIENFHVLLLVIITAITIFVLALLVYVMWRFNAKKNPNPSKTSHNTVIEVLWTAIPVIILVIIAIPSFRLLYFEERQGNPEITVIARGYQWNWAYEFPDQQIGEYASYMIPDDEIDLEAGQVRQLSTDAPLVLPADTEIQFLITANNVLHSFAMPSFGIKMDAVPGRMNEVVRTIDVQGTFYGQCSELCGTGHGFMPIEVEVVSREEWDEWVVEQTADADIDPENPPVLLTMTWDEAMERRDQQVALAD